MLVLGVGSLGAESAAWQRIAETLVGAAVGIATNLLFPPKVATAGAGQAIDGLADSVSQLLTGAADELTALVGDGDVAPVARSWLGRARRITHDIPPVGAALLQAEEGRRLNIRAAGTPDVSAGLRQGLEALEHSAITIRGMFRALVDATHDGAGWLEDPFAEDVLLGLAQTFRELAAGVDAFGQLVRDEAVSTQAASSSDVQSLRDALDGMHEARARLEDLLTAGVAPELVELHAAVLSTVKRLLREMDLDERIRRQVQLLRPTRPPLRRPGTPGPSGAPASPEPTPEAETQLLPTVPRNRRGRPRR
jgi:hypothetical protein